MLSFVDLADCHHRKNTRYSSTNDSVLHRVFVHNLSRRPASRTDALQNVPARDFENQAAFWVNGVAVLFGLGQILNFPRIHLCLDD